MVDKCIEGIEVCDCLDPKQEEVKRPTPDFKCIEVVFTLNGKKIVVTPELLEKYGLDTWRFNSLSNDDDFMKAIMFEKLKINIL